MMKILNRPALPKVKKPNLKKFGGKLKTLYSTLSSAPKGSFDYQRGAMAGIFFLNLLLLWALGITAFSNMKHIKFFNYPATRRGSVGENVDSESITAIFTGWGSDSQVLITSVILVL